VGRRSSARALDRQNRRRSGRDDPLVGGTQKPQEDGARAIEKACGYLANRSLTRLMRYADALRDGLRSPPASRGRVSLSREGPDGHRLAPDGRSPVPRPCSDFARSASGDFDAYWKFHLARDKERNLLHATRRARFLTRYPLPAPTAKGQVIDLAVKFSAGKSRTQSTSLA